MQAQASNQADGAAFSAPPPHRRERGIRAVIVLTFVTMVVEVLVGFWAGSMALLADGWHMATHVGALSFSAAAYAVARRFASHRAFAFGAGKVHALAGYTSALTLILVALAMITESISRLFEPKHIDFSSSLPVAVVGLLVNLVSVRLLHGEEDEHEHAAHNHVDHNHVDHNHRAAVLHIIADTLTSGLAIASLLLGSWLGWTWLDPMMGVVGGGVIIVWGSGLCRTAALELLNVELSPRLSDEIRGVLEAMDDVQVGDLRVWSLGQGARGCVVTVLSASPRDVSEYRERVLASFELTHLTIEVQRSGSRGATATRQP